MQYTDLVWICAYWESSSKRPENPDRERVTVPMSNFVVIWSATWRENGPSWTSSIYNTLAVCTGDLGINIYCIAYPFILQVIMQVLYIIILCSIKETNLEEKKLNSKSVIASKLIYFSHSDFTICNFPQDFFHKIYNRCQTKIWSFLCKNSWIENFRLMVSYCFWLQFQTSESLTHDFKEEKVWIRIKWLISTDTLCSNLNRKGSG